MRQFLAILYDSYREAVDGRIIMLMLAVAVVVIVLIGSLSFTPAEPAEGFGKVLDRFRTFYPDSGQGRRVLQTRAAIRMHDLQTTPDGYHMRLQVTAAGVRGPKQKESVDAFQLTVWEWKQPEASQNEVQRRGQPLQEAVEMPPVGPEGFGPPGEGEVVIRFWDRPVAADLNAVRQVTTEDMEAFLRNQFWVHGGMEAEVRYVHAVREKEKNTAQYEFDVRIPRSRAVRGWPHTIHIFFGALKLFTDANLGLAIYIIEDQIINGLGGAVVLLVGVIVTAFFIPNMLRKGSIDLLISKPISRWRLLGYKYVGGLTFVFLLTTVSVGGVWLVLALRSGHWDPRFLAVIPLLTFSFAILYAGSTLVAVWSRSAVAAMLLTIFLMLFLYIVGQVKSTLDQVRKIERAGEDVPAWVYQTVDTLNNVLPRYKDVDKLITRLIADGTLTVAEQHMIGTSQIDYPTWWGTFGVSLAYIVGLVGLACLWFHYRDY